MNKLLFIGHSHHLKTRSSSFFAELLSSRWELELFPVNPNSRAGHEVNKIKALDLGDYSGVILWQIDTLAPFFIERGVPTIVCPMYDASAGLEACHWISMERALILSFSLELHYLIAKAGVESTYIRYFPEADPHNSHDTPSANKRPADDPLKVFFWERRSSSHISLSSVSHLIKDLNVSHLHVHLCPDPGENSSNPAKTSLPYELTTSEWFSDKKEYYTILQDCDLFITPRYAEGIGLSGLEAMALGCCVVAHDSSTSNEYINNWRNGILVDFFDFKPLQATPSQIRAIGAKAFCDSRIHRNNWETHYADLALDAISRHIDSLAMLRRNSITNSTFKSRYSRLNVEILIHAHQDLDKYHAHLELLRQNHRPCTPAGKRSSFVSEINLLESKGRYDQAMRKYEHAMTCYPELISLYETLKQLLSSRMKLAQKHTQRINASPLRHFEVDKEANTTR